MESMFEHCGVGDLTDKDLEDKMNYLGKLLGVRALQQRQAGEEVDKAKKNYNTVWLAKKTLIEDMERIGIEMQARKMPLKDDLG